MEANWCTCNNANISFFYCCKLKGAQNSWLNNKLQYWENKMVFFFFSKKIKIKKKSKQYFDFICLLLIKRSWHVCFFTELLQCTHVYTHRQTLMDYAIRTRCVDNMDVLCDMRTVLFDIRIVPCDMKTVLLCRMCYVIWDRLNPHHNTQE